MLLLVLACGRTEDEACLVVDVADACPSVAAAADRLEGTFPDCAPGEVLEVLGYSHRDEDVRNTGLVDTAYQATTERCCYDARFSGGAAKCSDSGS